jgi:hypothetical protein
VLVEVAGAVMVLELFSLKCICIGVCAQVASMAALVWAGRSSSGPGWGDVRMSGRISSGLNSTLLHNVIFGATIGHV